MVDSGWHASNGQEDGVTCQIRGGPKMYIRFDGDDVVVLNIANGKL